MADSRSCFIRNKEHKWVLGTFHSWSMNTEVTVHGARVYPVAIVEFDSGEILEVEISRVRFKTPT